MIKKLSVTVLLLIHYLFSQQLPTIAVLDLIAKGIAEDEASVLTDKLRGELFHTGRYQVIERSVMDEILKEQGFQQTGCVSSECAVEAGQLIGVKYMVSGSIGRIEQTYLLSIGLINVATGEIEKSVQKELTGSLTDVLKEGVPHVVRELTKLLSVSDVKTDEPTTESKEPETEEAKKGSFRNGKIVVSLSYSLGIVSSRFDNFDAIPPLEDDLPLNVNGFSLGAGYRFGYHYLGAAYSYHPSKSYELKNNRHNFERNAWGIGIEWFFERLKLRDILSVAPGITLSYWSLKDHAVYNDEPGKTSDFDFNLFGGPKAKLELGWKSIHLLMSYTLLFVMNNGGDTTVGWEKQGEATYYEGTYSLENVIHNLCFGLSFQFR